MRGIGLNKKLKRITIHSLTCVEGDARRNPEGFQGAKVIMRVAMTVMMSLMIRIHESQGMTFIVSSHEASVSPGSLQILWFLILGLFNHHLGNGPAEAWQMLDSLVRS